MQQFQIPPKRSILIIGILGVCFFLYIFPLALIPLLKILSLGNVKTRIFISILLTWLCLALIYTYSRKVEKMNFLVWDEVNYSLNQFAKLVIIILLILFAGSMVIGTILKLTGFNMDNDKIVHLLNVLKANKLMILVLSASAAITEELIFRGYLLSRLQLLINDTYHSIVISAILFSIAHYNYGTMKQLLGTFFIGLVLAFYYNKYRNIKVLIVCHFLWDYFAFILFLHFK